MAQEQDLQHEVLWYKSKTCNMKCCGTRARPAKLKLVAALANQMFYSWLCLRDYLFAIL